MASSNAEAEDEQYQILLDRLTEYTTQEGDLPKQLALFLQNAEHNCKLSSLIVTRYQMRRAGGIDVVANILNLLLLSDHNSASLKCAFAFLKLVVLREDMSYVSSEESFIALLAKITYLKWCRCSNSSLIQDETFSDATLLVYAFAPLRSSSSDIALRDDYLLKFSLHALELCTGNETGLASDIDTDIKIRTARFLFHLWSRAAGDSNIAKKLPAIQIIGSNLSYFKKVKEWVAKHLSSQASSIMPSTGSNLHGDFVNYSKDLFTIDTTGTNEGNDESDMGNKFDLAKSKNSGDKAESSENEEDDVVAPLPKISKSIEQTPLRRRTRSMSASSTELEPMSTTDSTQKGGEKNTKSTRKSACEPKGSIGKGNEIVEKEEDENVDEIRPLPKISVGQTPLRRTRSMSASSVEIELITTPTPSKSAKKKFRSTRKSARKSKGDSIKKEEVIVEKGDIELEKCSTPKVSSSRRRSRAMSISSENLTTSPLGKKSKTRSARSAKRKGQNVEIVYVPSEEKNDEVPPLPTTAFRSPLRQKTRGMSVSSIESETPSTIALRRSSRKRSGKKS